MSRYIHCNDLKKLKLFKKNCDIDVPVRLIFKANTAAMRNYIEEYGV